MRNTSFQRKATPKAHIWRGDYLGQSALLSDLVQQSALLQGSLLDLGCGNRPYYALLKHIDHYVGYDIDVAGSTPDVTGMAHSLPFQDTSFDSVLCTQVLEHVADPQQVIREIARVLRPKGRLLLSAPQHWRLHEEPHDYFRYTKYGLTYLLESANLNIQTMQAQGSVWYVVGQAINNAIYERFGATLATRMAFTICNSAMLSMDRVWPDQGDTLNYIVYAMKPQEQ